MAEDSPMIQPVAHCDNVEIERLSASELSPADFHTKYFRLAKPVVITGATDQWPARAWTIENLVQRVGNNKVYIRGQTNQEGYRLGQKYIIRQDSFANYCGDLLAGNARARSSYLAVASLHQAFPQLEGDVPLPDYLRHDGKLHLGPYMWVALKGHYEFCHFDPDDNFLVIIRGRKRVRLFGHHNLQSLYPNPLGSYGKTIQSRVDLDNVDPVKFPSFAHPTNGKKLVCQQTVLQPGEMLFIPAFYWHQVTALDTGISVNMFYGDASENGYLDKILKPPYFDHFRYWFLNVIEQNRKFESFSRMLTRLPEVVLHFFVKQWHDTPSQDHKDALVNLVLDYCQLDKIPPIMEDENMDKFPPLLKIRGLLHRNGTEAKDNEEKYQEYISSQNGASS